MKFLIKEKRLRKRMGKKQKLGYNEQSLRNGQNLAQDPEFARRTEEAYKRYEKGKFISMPADEFLEELKKW